MRTNFDSVQQSKISGEQRFKLLAEFEDVIDNMKLELDRAKGNLQSQYKPTPKFSPRHVRDRHELLDTEESMVVALKDRLKGLRSLMSVTNEVFLLSSKHKYTPSNKFSVASSSTNVQMSDQEF